MSVYVPLVVKFVPGAEKQEIRTLLRGCPGILQDDEAVVRRVMTIQVERALLLAATEYLHADKVVLRLEDAIEHHTQT